MPSHTPAEKKKNATANKKNVNAKNATAKTAAPKKKKAFPGAAKPFTKK